MDREQHRPHNVVPIRLGLPIDDARVGALIAEHGAQVERRIRRLIRNPGDVPDVAQRTWIRVAQALPQLRNPERPLPWLMRIAQHCSIDWLREQRDHGREQAWPGDDVLEIVDSTAGPERLLLGREQRAHLLLALGGLDEPGRRLLLWHVAGVPYDEVARRLGISANLAAVRVSRIRKRLRAVLDAVAADPARCGVSAVELLRLIPGEPATGEIERRVLESHARSCSTCQRRYRHMLAGERALWESLEGPASAAA